MTNPMSGNQRKRFSPPARKIVWTLPNFISFLRLLSIPVVAWLVATHHHFLALLALAVGAATDGLDGYLARKLDQVSLLGQLLDPIADRLLIICSAISLGMAGIVPWWLLIIIVSRDIVLFVEVLLLSNHGYGPLPVHFVGKTGTAMLLVSIPVLIISDLVHRDFLFYLFRCFGLACAWWGIGLYWLAGAIYLYQGHRLMKKAKAAATAQPAIEGR